MLLFPRCLNVLHLYQLCNLTVFACHLRAEYYFELFQRNYSRKINISDKVILISIIIEVRTYLCVDLTYVCDVSENYSTYISVQI